MPGSGNPRHTPLLVEYGSPNYRACVELRNTILRRPLGLILTPEQIQTEADDIHIGYLKDSLLVGCVVLTPLSSLHVRLRQMAVHPAFRGRGIGTALVSYSEQDVRTRGFSQCILHARESAVSFYLKQGYVVEGATFTEVSLPHRLMRKTL